MIGTTRITNSKKLGVLPVLLAGVLTGALLVCAPTAAWAKADPCKNNKKPVIHALTPDQPMPYPGETVHITSSITDEDSTIASYEWKANGMQWQAGGPSWVYVVPADKKPGDKINVHLKVRDTCGKVAQEHVKLTVVAADEEEPEVPEDGEIADEDEEALDLLPVRRPPEKSLRMTLTGSITGPRPNIGPVVDWRVDSPERQRELDRAYARRIATGQIAVAEYEEED